MRRMLPFMFAISAVIATLCVQSLVARQITSVRFEYLRLTPGVPVSDGVFTPNRLPEGYQACVARAAKWDCRAFTTENSFDHSLREAMTTLGTEGWELVSVINETENLGYPKGLTYLFKRPS